MEQSESPPIKNKIGLKVFLTIIIQLLIAFPLYILGGILLYQFISINPIVEIIVAIIFFLISLYLALLILGKKFIPQDINDFSRGMGIIYLAFGISILVMSFLTKSLYILDIIIQLVLYPLLGYLLIRLVLQRKFNK